MKILLTGATGFLGKHLLRHLLDADHQVVALCRPTSDIGKLGPLAEKVIWIRQRDSRHDEIFRSNPGLGSVIHLATAYGRDGEPASSVLKQNTLFPLELLEASLSAGVKRFIACDTGFNAAPRNSYRYLPAYQLSKRHFSHWGEMVALEKPELTFVNLMLYMPYGPGDDVKKFVPSLIGDLVRSTPELKLTPGMQTRDFVHVDDVCRALLLLASGTNLTTGFHSLDCGGGAGGVTIRHFVETVHRLARSKTNLLFGALPYRENEIMDMPADISGLKALGWQPSVSLEDGIRSILCRDFAFDPTVAEGNP